MAEYKFKTTWLLPGPVDRVWLLIRNTEDWPQWWRGVVKVEKLRQGDEDDVGSVFRQTWKSVLPYTLTFVAEIKVVNHHRFIEGTATGELEGAGRWVFTPKGEETLLEYYWEIRTTQWWMNALAPLLRPLFSWNHHVVMKWGEEGMRRMLIR